MKVDRNVALCYVRQSYTRNENDMHSPERQKANIEAYCAKKGWTPEWYIDAEGHRSGRSVKDRPGWLALEQRLGDPDVVALVANDLARIHRKTWRIGQLLERTKEASIQVVLAEPGRDIVDTSTPMGELYITILAMQDEAYANDISHRAKASIQFRKSQGKTVGLPPFGTIRNTEGYLVPDHAGAWLLPDGKFVPGKTGDTPPQEGAIWRGYYETAAYVLRLFAAGDIGIGRLACRLNDEGWPYCNRKKKPCPFERGDVRRLPPPGESTVASSVLKSQGCAGV
jgi:DNA invertase Pin-like site-specific DNA recombinase